ncbi:hypothetical protein P3T32_002988 [Ralstonia sp. GP73]|jgi:hypothetical protein|uniref:DUF4935 domain-containing protein n=2 Tax=Ralstonia TaxID=48736 RepID=A0AAD2F4P3_9RALS|nr:MULTISPECIES: PIN domain-containing protein [Ralstonia]MBT2179485.1 DUF4935 domain-containing protein [Ralstonia pickettii]MCL6455466.1 DUF4935 domain-containing protein [Ralstonia pickettii]MDH6643131.1 hypothetical protein [Ralstonia sp. GP73]CAJ0715719.1 hypothetical protein LMG7143_03480 [Ralstonia sp. LMG 18095]CAJ0799621.1 hypothetical protein R77560_03341 [Ralstonia sp. LMG 18095]
MTRSRKKALYVVFDTNAIFTKSGDDIVNSTASSLIADHSNHGDLQIFWILPYIVRAEREYQMRQSYMQHVETSRRVAKFLSETWDISPERVSSAISQSIDRQLLRLNIKVVKPNIENIDWGSVIDAAVFRLPPFEHGPREKGFRDAVVCETFLQIASSLTGRDTALLITDDRLATQAVKQRLTNARVLTDLNALREEIMLRVSHIDAETAAEIEKKASLLFLQNDNINTLWYKKDIPNLIFGNPAISDRVRQVPVGATWELVNHYITPARLVRKEANRVYFQTDYVVNGKSRVWIPNEIPTQPELSSYQQQPAGLYGLGTAFPADALGISPAGQAMSRSMPLAGLLGLGTGAYYDTNLPTAVIEIRWSATYNRRKSLTHAEVDSCHVQQADGVSTELTPKTTSSVGPYL